MTMTEKFKILGRFIKDLSSETPDIETYLFVRDRIGSYQLNIDINSKALKNKMIEVTTTFKFEDKENNKKKSYFEILNVTIVKISDDVKEKKEMEKIILVAFGAMISLIAFFLKKENAKIERISGKLREIEIDLAKNGARDSERWEQTQRLLEDRRQDAIKIFEKLNRRIG